MQIYRGSIELLDYVFYATTERGKVYETGAFVHNYALVYALGLVRSETYTYASLRQEPHYQEELSPLGNYFYITPAEPQRVAWRLVQWNTIREGYAFPSKLPSVGYPDWGFARVLRPQSRFTFYVLLRDSGDLPRSPAIHDLLGGRAVRVRLGKFLGKALLRAEAAQSVTEGSGAFQTEAFLNWHDLDSDPAVCDVVAASLPTRLLARAHFAEGAYYQAHFKDVRVCLPAHMRFLGRQSPGVRQGRG